jgi:hypothetical protein
MQERVGPAEVAEAAEVSFPQSVCRAFSAFRVFRGSL